MGLNEKVKELGERVQSRQKELDAEKLARKRMDALGAEIREAPEMKQMDFFCRECNRDFIATGYKRVHRDGMGTYLGACPNGHGCVRYITEKWRDPYWELSPKVRFDRLKYADDMLTPEDPRFKTVYPQQWKAIEARREEYERATGIQS